MYTHGHVWMAGIFSLTILDQSQNAFIPTIPKLYFTYNGRNQRLMCAMILLRY